MNEQDKELLLKDLCARLPYRVKVHDKCAYPHASFIKEGNYKLTAQDISDYISEDSHDYHKTLENIKPYLRPMSSMTKEEEKEYSKYAHFGNTLGDWIKSIDYLNSHHFDYRGLIDKGLALPAPDGMYDFK